MVLSSYMILRVDCTNFLMSLMKMFMFGDLFYVQNESSDVPSAPPINDYDQDKHLGARDDTRSCNTTNFTSGLSAKKDHQVGGGANLADKNDR